MYILDIVLKNQTEPIQVPIESFSVMSSEQDIALGGAAIGGLYCILAEDNIDKYFYLVQKDVNSITVYQKNEEEVLKVVYSSGYWDRIVSLSGSFDPNLKKIIATLRISHLFEGVE